MAIKISGTTVIDDSQGLRITGISTFTNGPVLVGSATSTETASQPLQVTGGGYFSGSVGIGSTNPSSLLTVQGDGLFTGIITARNAVTQDSISLNGRAGGTSSFNLSLTPTTLGASRTVTFQDVSGTVYVSGGTDVTLADGGTNASLTAVNGGVVYSTSSAMAITAAGTAGQVLTSNGAGAPTWQTAAVGVTISDDTSTNATRYVMFDDATSGSVSTVNVSSTKLQFNPSTGNLVAGGTVTANSDEKLKENIKTIENALDKVLSLRGVEFDRIDTEDHQIGVIAQEVEKVIPEVVYPKSPSPDYETKSVAYGNLIGLLIEAIKEQNQKISELERKLEDNK